MTMIKVMKARQSLTAMEIQPSKWVSLSNLSFTVSSCFFFYLDTKKMRVKARRKKWVNVLFFMLDGKCCFVWFYFFYGIGLCEAVIYLFWMWFAIVWILRTSAGKWEKNVCTFSILNVVCCCHVILNDGTFHKAIVPSDASSHHLCLNWLLF